MNNSSLNGLRILNTRPKNQAQTLTRQITENGGMAIECPTIEIQANGENWLELLPALETVNQAIFVSANAVHYSLIEFRQKQINWPSSIEVIAIGQGTANALNKFEIQANHIPELPDSEHLLSLNSLQQLKNQTVLLFKGEGGRKLIEDVLLLRGAHIISLPVYKRVAPQINPQFINSLWNDDGVDIILLTSEQSIQNLLKLFHEKALVWLQDKPCLVISERLAKVAASFGMKKIIISHPDRMINTLCDYSQGLIHGQ